MSSRALATTGAGAPTALVRDVGDLLAGSADVAEERAQLFDEQRGLFEGGEVAAAVELVPVAQVLEAALGPPAGDAEDLLGKDRAAGGNLDRAVVDVAEALPVQPRR